MADGKGLLRPPFHPTISQLRVLFCEPSLRLGQNVQRGAVRLVLSVGTVAPAVLETTGRTVHRLGRQTVEPGLDLAVEVGRRVALALELAVAVVATALAGVTAPEPIEGVVVILTHEGVGGLGRPERSERLLVRLLARRQQRGTLVDAPELAGLAVLDDLRRLVDDFGEEDRALGVLGDDAIGEHLAVVQRLRPTLVGKNDPTEMTIVSHQAALLGLGLDEVAAPVDDHRDGVSLILDDETRLGSEVRLGSMLMMPGHLDVSSESPVRDTWGESKDREGALLRTPTSHLWWHCFVSAPSGNANEALVAAGLLEPDLVGGFDEADVAGGGTRIEDVVRNDQRLDGQRPHERKSCQVVACIGIHSRSLLFRVRC